MSPRERLRELALTVNEGLGAYIAVHNAIFEEAATVKSFLKNLSGRGLSISKLLYVFNAGFALTKAVIADNLSCDIEVKDSEFLIIADELFGYAE